MKQISHLIKLSFVLMLIISGCGIIVINPKFQDLSQEEQEAITPKRSALNSFFESYYDNSSHHIFSIEANQAKEIIKQTKEKFSLVVFYANWCFPCKQQMPKVVEFHKKHKKEMALILISTTEWSELNSDRKYLNSLDLHIGSSMVVDIFKYGQKLSPKVRYKTFYEDLNISDYDSKLIGFPLFILVDNQLNHYYTNTGNFDSKTIADLINKKSP